MIERQADAMAAKKPIFTENYGLYRNKNAMTKPHKKSTGRKSNSDEEKRVVQSIDIYPDDAERQQCHRQRTRYVWWLKEGKAIYIWAGLSLLGLFWIVFFGDCRLNLASIQLVPDSAGHKRSATLILMTADRVIFCE